MEFGVDLATEGLDGEIEAPEAQRDICPIMFGRYSVMNTSVADNFDLCSSSIMPNLPP